MDEHEVRTAGETRKESPSLPQWREPVRIGKTILYHADCFDWIRPQEDGSFHAVVTDVPYGLHEYTVGQQAKLRDGKGGVWQIPAALEGQAVWRRHCLRPRANEGTWLGPASEPQTASLFAAACTGRSADEKGVVLGPLAGAGSTLAAAQAVDYESIGVEKDEHYFEMAREAVPKFAQFDPTEER